MPAASIFDCALEPGAEASLHSCEAAVATAQFIEPTQRSMIVTTDCIPI